jgi:hypothetical protein
MNLCDVVDFCQQSALSYRNDSQIKRDETNMAEITNIPSMVAERLPFICATIAADAIPLEYVVLSYREQPRGLHPTQVFVYVWCPS